MIIEQQSNFENVIENLLRIADTLSSVKEISDISNDIKKINEIIKLEQRDPQNYNCYRAEYDKLFSKYKTTIKEEKIRYVPDLSFRDILISLRSYLCKLLLETLIEKGILSHLDPTTSILFGVVKDYILHNF